MIMTPEQPEWEKFRQILAEMLELRCRCACRREKFICQEILGRYFPEIDLPGTLAYFDARGGYCDCEVLRNVR